MSWVWAFPACWIWLWQIFMSSWTCCIADLQLKHPYRWFPAHLESDMSETDSREALRLTHWVEEPLTSQTDSVQSMNKSLRPVWWTKPTKSLTQKNEFFIWISLVYLQQMLIRVHIETFDFGKSEHSLRHKQQTFEILKGSHLWFVF